MPPIVVMLSVDTEEDNWQAARTGVSVENVRELPAFQLHCERLGVRPTYFTTYQVASAPWAAGLLRDLAADARAEIAAHLHPWNTPPLDEPFEPRNSMTKNLPAALQDAKLATLTSAIEAIAGRRPTAFRAGRYGLGRETTQALIRQGYRVDSSVTPWISWESTDDGPDFIGAPVRMYTLDGTTDPREPVPGGPLLEVPLSSGFLRAPFEDWSPVYDAVTGRWGRSLRLAALAARAGLIRRVVVSPEISPARDMLRLARHLVANGATHLQLTLHSTTLRPGLSPYACSRRDVQHLYDRVDRFIEGLARVAPVTFGTVGEAADPVPRAAEGGAGAPPARAVPVRIARPKRLLVISYHCPPDGAVGGLRWAGFAKYLVRMGWEVHFLTASPATEPGLRDGFHVHVCRRSRTLLDLYGSVARWIRSLRPSPGGAAAAGGGTTFLDGGPPTLRRTVASLLWFPDASRGWTLKAIVCARRLMRRMQPDVVVTSGPPHTAHVVGAWATARLGIPMLADFRDPWIFDWHATDVERRLARALQRRVFRVAREIIANTQELTEELRAQYPGLRVTWMRNGVDRELLPPRSRAPGRGLTIVHAGNLYWKRSLGPVLRAFRVFLDRHPGVGPAEGRIRIAGLVEPRHASELEDEMRETGLAPFVERLGVLPRPEALRLAAASSASLVLAQDQARQVPAKLYELVAMGVPTIVITEAGSAADREGRRLGAHVFAPNDVGPMADLFGELWEGREPPAAEAAAPVDYAGLAQQMARLLLPADAA